MSATKSAAVSGGRSALVPLPGPLAAVDDAGVYVCAVCDRPLFDAADKYVTAMTVRV